jgi:hypothetical protein
MLSHRSRAPHRPSGRFTRSCRASAVIVLLLWVASPTRADPEITFDPMPLGGALVGWNVGIEFDDGLELSTFVDVTFAGGFNQILFDGLDVDTDEMATDVDGLLDYAADLDSYFITSVWPDVVILEGGEVMSVLFEFAAGSGEGSQIVDFIELAYLVLPEGEVPSYDALVSRGDENFYLIPEPGSTLASATAIGALAVLCRRKRRIGGHSRRARSSSRLALPSLFAVLALVGCGEADHDGSGERTASVDSAITSTSESASTAESSPPPAEPGLAPTTTQAAPTAGEEAGAGEAQGGVVSQRGDANGDGAVDDADYTVWAENYGESVAPGTRGDLNQDRVVDGADYTIWADNYGSRVDPCAEDDGTDSDGDGLSDCTENYVSLTLPDFPDTDGDGRHDGFEWRLFDPENTNYVYNPRIADLPTIAVDLKQLPVVEIDYTINQGQTKSIGTDFGGSSTQSIATGRGGEISEQVSYAHSINASLMLGTEVGVSASATGPEAESKFKAELTVGFESTVTQTQGSSVHWSQDESASRTATYQESQSESQTEGFSSGGGRLSAVVEVRNSGVVGFRISNLALTAQLVDSLRPLAVETIGTMQYDGDEPLVADIPIGVSTGALTYKISDLTWPGAQALMRDRRDITVAAASYILTDRNGNSTLLREDDVAALTATVIIDYGAGGGQVDRFRVAVRQPTGEKSITALDALEEILGLDVVQGVGVWTYPDGSGLTPYGLKAIGTHAMSTSTNRYWQVAHNHNNEMGTLARTTDIMNLVLNEFDLGDIVLRGGDRLVLRYIGDQDRDGIPDRVEVAYGTDPAKSDTDEDGLTDPEELYGWLTNLATPPCDEGDLVLVFSDPFDNDSDDDGTFDGDEKAACSNPSADFVAKAGEDEDVNIRSQVELVGSYRGQAAETPLYTWQLIYGPRVLDSEGNPTKTLEGQRPTFTAPENVVTLTFELTISIGDLQQKDQVTINVFEDLNRIFVGKVHEDGFEAGTRKRPFGSLLAANAQDRSADLYVMTQEDHVYELKSSLLMNSGASVYGGYDSDWVRNVEDNKTGLLVTHAGVFQAAIYYDEVTQEATVSGLAISGVNVTLDTSSSVVAIMANPDSNQGGSMRVLHNKIEVPDIEPWITWQEKEGHPGSSYGMFFRNLQNLEVRNNVVYAGKGGFGYRGANVTPGAQGEGKNGGVGGKGSTSVLGGSGEDGANGVGFRGSSCSRGGIRGRLFLATSPAAGTTGCVGQEGDVGAGVVGQAYVFNPRYVPAVAAIGVVGTEAGGGGGGGGGQAAQFWKGGKGGDGGKGGAGGNPGEGGVGGGASIGIWLHQIQNAVLRDNAIIAADGGDGGQSGNGGRGGWGNGGGGGGAATGIGVNGAPGGAGGQGGRGGDGGAGHGGPSIAIFVDEVVGPIFIEGNRLTTSRGGRGGWTWRDIDAAGAGGDSFGVYLHTQGGNGIPTVEDNEFFIGNGGAPFNSFNEGTPGDRGSKSWE